MGLEISRWGAGSHGLHFCIKCSDYAQERI